MESNQTGTVFIRARFLRSIYDSSGEEKKFGAYCINRYRVADGQPLYLPDKDGNMVRITEFSAMGTDLPSEKGVLYELAGYWKVRKKTGEKQLDVKSFGLTDPENISQVRGFLDGVGFVGVSSVVLEDIINRYGSSFFSVLKENPEKLSYCCGLRQSEYDKLILAYHKRFELHELFKYLSEFGVSIQKTNELMEKCGHGVLQAIKENPYSVYEKCAGFDFKLCAQIAAKHEIRTKNVTRVGCAIRSQLCDGYRFGNLFANEDELVQDVSKSLFTYSTKVEEGDILHVLDQMIAVGKLVRRGKKHIYLPEADAVEDSLAKKLVAIMEYHKANDDIPEVTLDSAIESAAETLPFTPEPKQLEAVRTCMSAGVSVITGGPGTGKSTVLSLVLKAYQRLDPRAVIALLAPSGKAAKRMKECTKKDAYTIHKYLRATGEIDAGNTDGYRPIFPADLVVIDESSMCDIFVTCALLKALPERTKLIFVGDVDQLPSVGPGNVLRSLISSGCIPTTALNVIHRQGADSPIVSNAAKINKGDLSINWCKDFRFIDAASAEETQKLCMEAYLKERDRVGIDNVAALTPYRNTKEFSSNVMAPKLQNIVNPRMKDSPFLQVSNREFRIGDRVMQTRNTCGLNNGDIGVVLKIGNSSSAEFDYSECVVADFDGYEVKLEGSDLEALESSLCYTIHRSQGSEYKTVVIPLFSEEEKKGGSAFLTRNLLYTAVTRAKERVIIVGSSNTFYRAIAECPQKPRNSLLGKRIQMYYRLAAQE